MRTTRLLFGISVLLFSMAVWAQSDTSQQHTAASGENSTPVTIRGCVTGSAGAYVLVDQRGKPYMLQGSNNSLDKMIRHEVEVTGRLVNETGTDHSQTSTSEQNSRTQPPGATMQVSSVREISDTRPVAR